MNSFVQKIVFALLAGVCFCNCGTEVDYYYTTDFVVKNDSSHAISVKGNSYIGDVWYPTLLDTTIQSNRECRIRYNNTYDLGEFTGYACNVTFDNTLEVVHYPTREGEIAIEHSICDENSITRKKTGKHETHTVCTYTFTDADYDRAVEWNAKYGATHAAQ